MGSIYICVPTITIVDVNNGVFPLPDSSAYSYCDSYSNNMRKGSTGTNSNGHSNAKLLWKLLKNHLISTDISVRSRTVAICIEIRIRIGSVETVLHIITGRNKVVAKVIFLHLFVILFTGWCLPQYMLGYQAPQEQTPPPLEADTPQADTHPQEQTPPRADPPWKQTPAYSQWAAGTHPTGMHSCYISHLNGNRNRSRAAETHHKP